jgi:nucleoside-diphosphate kinase
MSLERTFSIIKPDAVAAGTRAPFWRRFKQAGFKILGLRMTRLSEAQAPGLLRRAFARSRSSPAW